MATAIYMLIRVLIQLVATATCQSTVLAYTYSLERTEENVREDRFRCINTGQNG